MISRRNFLLMGSAAGAFAVTGGGAALVLSDPYRGWITATLMRSLPGFDLESAGLARFIEEYSARRRDNIRLRIFAAAERWFDTRWALPNEMASDFEEEERRIVSDFLLGSDFFQNYPKGVTTITYFGVAEACTSPFATF